SVATAVLLLVLFLGRIRFKTRFDQEFAEGLHSPLGELIAGMWFVDHRRDAVRHRKLVRRTARGLDRSTEIDHQRNCIAPPDVGARGSGEDRVENSIVLAHSKMLSIRAIHPSRDSTKSWCR